MICRYAIGSRGRRPIRGEGACCHLQEGSIEAVSDAVVRLSADEKVSGRSAFASPLGAFDLGDDIWSGFGGAVCDMQEQLIAVVKSGTLGQQAESTVGDNA